jgi:hypothetical protein
MEGVVVGYRTWRIAGGRLYSPFDDSFSWENGGKTTASCAQLFHNPAMLGMAGHGAGEGSPAAECHCGLHAYREPPERLYADDGVLGVVVQWGRSQVHAQGVRSEFALPVALCRMDEMQLGTFEAVRAYAGEWGLPFCQGIDELVAEGARYGEPAPEEELPEEEYPPVTYRFAGRGPGVAISAGADFAPKPLDAAGRKKIRQQRVMRAKALRQLRISAPKGRRTR